MDKSQHKSKKNHDFHIDPEGDIRLELVRGATRMIGAVYHPQVICWGWENDLYLWLVVDWRIALRLRVRRTGNERGTLSISPKSHRIQDLRGGE